MTGMKWLIVGAAVVAGVSVMTFVTTNPLELVLAAAVFAIMGWQGLRNKGGNVK